MRWAILVGQAFQPDDDALVRLESLTYKKIMSERRVEAVRLTLPAGGWLQGAVWSTSPPSPCAVLFIHGFGSVRSGEKAQALEAACAQRGWTFAAFDFRGHGESGGTMIELTGHGLLADLSAIQTHLQARGTQFLLPVGSSMGGWAAAWFALLHPDLVPACVLLAPAFHFLTGRWTKLTEAERDTWRQTGRLRVRNDWIDTEIGYGIVADISRYPYETLLTNWCKPLLIFHGLADDVVPVATSLRFVEEARHPTIELRLFKDGDHRLTAHRRQIAEGTCSFFEQQLHSIDPKSGLRNR